MRVERQVVMVFMEETVWQVILFLESLVFARKAADDMIFGQTPEYVRADAIDMNMYESREELLNACHETVLKEIERMKKKS